MPRRLRMVLAVAALGVGAAALGFTFGRLLHAPAVEAPKTATDFALRDLAGKTYGLGAWRGKLVLLNFWATWCPPCRREIPLFIALQHRYQTQGLQIVGISVDNPEAVARYWQEMKINYPLLLADDGTFALMDAYGNTSGGLPYSVLIRPDGRIAAVKIGAYGEKELEELVKPLLPGAKPALPQASS
jgi:peroxiredoxin